MESPIAKAEITKNIEKSFSKVVAKIEKEQEKQADVIAKENKKADHNIEVTPKQLAHSTYKPAVSHERHEQLNPKGQTEKNDHQEGKPKEK